MIWEPNYVISARVKQWSLYLLMGILLLFIINNITSLFFISDFSKNKVNAHPAVNTLSASQKPLKIAYNAFFGDYVPTDLKESEVSQTLLDIALVGVLLAEKEEDSQVIIRTASEEEKIYSIGETIPGGAVIKRITDMGILLEYKGSLERLSLPKNDIRFEPPAKPLILE